MKVFAHGSTVMLGRSPRESFQNALSTRADAIEVDVRQSADSGFICHDAATFKGCSIGEAGKKWLLDNGGLDIRGVMDLARHSDKPVLFDIKPPDSELPEMICSEADDFTLPRSHIIFGVRNLDQARNAQQFAGESGILGFLPFEQLQGYKNIVGPGQYFRLWERDSTPENITAIQEAGLLPVTMTGYRGKGPDMDFVQQHFHGDEDFPEPGQTSRSMLATAFNRGAYGVLVNNPDEVCKALTPANDDRPQSKGPAMPKASEPIIR
jgi:hypothetical protein